MLFTQFCLQVQNVFHMCAGLAVQIALIKHGTSVCKRGLWGPAGDFGMEAVCISNLHVEGSFGLEKLIRGPPQGESMYCREWALNVLMLGSF